MSASRGRWNSIDLAVLGLIGFILLGGLSAGTKWIFRSTAPLPMRTVEMDLDLADHSADPLPPIGEMVVDMNAKPIGQVVDVWTLPMASPSFHQEGEGDTARSGLTLRVTLPFKGSLFQLNGKLSSLGSVINFKTSQKTYSGFVKAFSPRASFWVQASVRSLGISSEVASIIQVGDFQRSPSGRVVSKISQIHSNDVTKAPLAILPGPQGTLKMVEATLSSSAATHEILLSLQLLVQSEGDGYLFQDKPLRVGQEVMFDTSVYSMRGQLLNVTTLEGQPLLPRFIPQEYYVEEKVRVKVRFQVTEENLVRLIKVGDEERRRDGEVLARVDLLEIRQPETLRVFTLFGAGAEGRPKWNILSETEERNYSIVARMGLTCRIRGDGAIFYQGKQLRIGSLIEFRQVRYQMEGVVTDFVSDTPESEPMLHRVQMETDFLSDPLLPVVAHLIQEGDLDQPLKEEAAVEVVQVASRKQVFRASPWDVKLQRVRLKLRLRCIQDGTRILFNGKSLKVGKILALNFPQYDLSGTILSLKAIEP